MFPESQNIHSPKNVHASVLLCDIYLQNIYKGQVMSLHTLGPWNEYVLQGSILEGSRDVLLHRLNGLCDPSDTGPEKFHDHEMVYQIGTSLTDKLSTACTC